jgi:hypothetical protein
MTMKNTHLLLTTLTAIAAVGVFAISGCSSDDSATNPGDDGGIVDSGPVNGGDGSTDSGPQTPAPPTLGVQIDRMGRPAINTALNHTFDKTAAAGTAEDAYNADTTESNWVTAYSPQFAANLAVLDALDGVCGNQPGYKAGSGYGLAPALADDQLYLLTGSTVTTCATYLAVEANALNILPNTDCGGRRPNDDVIDESYSLLAAGGISGVGDGVNAAPTPAVSTFPYLVAPH